MYSKTIFLVLAVFSASFSFIGIAVDSQFVNPELFAYYQVGRVIWGSVGFICGITVFFNLVSVRTGLVVLLLNMMMYSIHGQYFVPCYYLGYLEAILFVSLFFPIKKKVLYPIIIVSGAVLSYVVSISPASYADTPLLKEKFIYDSITAIWIISFFSILAHNKITMARKEKDKLFRKFIDIGKDSSFIIHDLKGLMTYPIGSLYDILDAIQTIEISSSKKNEITELINETIKDLDTINKFTKEVTKLTLPEGNIDKKEISLADIVESAKVLSYKGLKNIEIKHDPTETLFANEVIIKKITFNLIKNAIDSLTQDKITDPTIRIYIEDAHLVIHDNGVGFNKKIIKKINKESNTFITTKSNGSGLGLSIVKELVSLADFKIKFENDNGAKIKIKIN